MRKPIIKIFSLLLVGIMAFILTSMLCAYIYMELFLPSVSQLKEAKLQAPLRIFTEDNKLIAEFGDIRRVPVSFEEIPKPLIDAVLATEDKRFYEHSGVDILGLGRAALKVLATGHKVEGGSTITMQVARNFYLTRKKTYTRKIKEILLAIKIDRNISKQKTLELYFNKVFLGEHAYGFGAAAQIYYGKKLNKLSLAQMATLAGLPKAPSSMNPVVNPKGAKERRNHVLSRMLETHYITKTQFTEAINAPMTAKLHTLKVSVYAPYVAELIRHYLYQKYGEDIYSTGLEVYTTINSRLQQDADDAVRTALLDYDKRHGYRHPETNLGELTLDSMETWPAQLKTMPSIIGLQVAAVINVGDHSAQALLASGEEINIPWSNIKWAQPRLKSGYLGAIPKQPSDVLKVGDVIRIQKNPNGWWSLSQVPQVQGAFVAVNPNSGAITAMVGGLNYSQSNFNHVTQAKRQAGSSFKPFIYAGALDQGLNLATIVNDSPIVLQDSGEKALWRPQNDTLKFNGPTRLKVGLAKSLNLVSIRILQQIGIPYTTKYLERFGFSAEEIPQSLSLALGTANVTPLQLAEGYSVFANGGYLVKPYIIERIQGIKKKPLFQAKAQTLCDNCKDIETPAPRTMSPQTNYLIHTALKDVIKEGTGKAARSLNRTDLAGKTGTTNDQHDAWFSGYNRNLVAIAWVGFDTPQTLGEYGAQATLPMWINFMKQALKGKPTADFSTPEGIITARIDPKTGKRVQSGASNYIYEVFREGNLPEYETVRAQTPSTNTNKNQASVADIY